MATATPIRLSAAILLLLCALPGSENLGTEQVQATEAQVEAAYLLNFGKFFKATTGQPKSAPFTICIMGEDASFLHLMQATVAGESVDGRPVTTRQIARVEDGLQCDEVFLSASERKHLNADLATLSKAPVLTVSDLPGFASRGGMIGFVLQDKRLRFEVNLEAASKSGISLSSQLLKIAVRVSGAPEPGGPR